MGTTALATEPFTAMQWPQVRPYGRPIDTYVDPAEFADLKTRLPAHHAQQEARRAAALRIIEQKALEPDADRDLLAVLSYLTQR